MKRLLALLLSLSLAVPAAAAHGQDAPASAAPTKPRARALKLRGAAAKKRAAAALREAALEEAAEPTDETQAAAASAPIIQRRYSFEDLGLDREIRRDATREAITLLLPTRADLVLTKARLTLLFARHFTDAAASRVEVRINEEQVGVFEGAQLTEQGEHVLEIDPAFLGERNILTLRVANSATSETVCQGRVSPGTWNLIAGGSLEVSGTALVLASDLSLLPLPFADPEFIGRDDAVNMAFLAPPDESRLRAAAMVASWFGTRAGSKLRFPVTIGRVPDRDGVVFVLGSEAAALKLPRPTAPTLHMFDFEGHKILAIMGRTPDELLSAARALALAKTQELRGSTLIVNPLAEPPTAPKTAPRWMVPSERVLIADVPGSGRMELLGAGGGTMRFEFRVPPDLFFWQIQHPALDLAWSSTLPKNARTPRVNVEMNGTYVGKLPVTRIERGQAWGRGKLELVGDRLPGYNDLVIHVDYGEVACADASGPARFTLDPGSGLHLGTKYTHFATYPDMSMFVDDGFPFTRAPDLSETAAVLATIPAPHEIETLLTVVAHFAAVTGTPETGLAVVGPDDLTQVYDRDLLVIGAADNHALIGRWAPHLPLVFERGRPFARLPQRDNLQVLLTWLSGRNVGAEVERAGEITSHDSSIGAVMGIQSPLNPKRAAVVVTAADDARMPLLRDLQGSAESRSHEADLLVSSRGTLWMFHLGFGYDVGILDDWRRILHFFSQHWVALFPFVVVGSILLALVLRSLLLQRARAMHIGAGAVVFMMSSFFPTQIHAQAWPHFERFVSTHVEKSGRVVDHSAEDISTSEGQAYTLFFALVANERELFERVLEWTSRNLSRGDLGRTLPAWRWGKAKDGPTSGKWGILDKNSASDADLWIGYTLLEASRLWHEERYARQGRALLANVVRQEVSVVPGLGPTLLPGAVGFVIEPNRRFRLNPSYVPLQLVRRLAALSVPGPWNALPEGVVKLVRETAKVGFVADWVAWVAQGEQGYFEAEPIGSYDAVRVYLWAAMLDAREPLRAPLLAATQGPVTALRTRGVFPEKVKADTGEDVGGPTPPGFSAVGEVLAKAAGDAAAEDTARRALDDSLRDDLYALAGDIPRYYDQVLTLFARGYADGKYRFGADGSLRLAWEQ